MAFQRDPYLGSKSTVIYLGSKSTVAYLGSESTVAYLGSKSTVAYLGSKSTVACLGSKSTLGSASCVAVHNTALVVQQSTMVYRLTLACPATITNMLQ